MFGILYCPKCRVTLIYQGYVFETTYNFLGKKKRIKKKQYRCPKCSYYKNV
jgi:hypothetical protein